MSLRIGDLIRYGAPRSLVEWWERDPGGELLPLQERAVRDGVLFSGLSLILRGPTASGKSFAGEMAAACSAFRGRRAVLLSPLRSLAEEQYERLRERYGPLGCRVILATREHRAHDSQFRRGGFDLAVAVTEKFLGLAAAHPALPRMVGTVVADELDLLADPDRGCALALALETARRAHCRIVGLSGELPWAPELARNLGARLIQGEIRPVPLCLGVLRNGRYRYRIPPDRTPREEVFAELEGSRFELREEAMIETVRALGGRGERCLIFTRSRMEAARLAVRLAAESPWPCAREAFDEAVALPATYHRDLLLQTLTGGVAFHSGDLTPPERRVVEKAFRQGALRAVCATATLAWGVNLPADNVLLPPEKWVAGPERGMPWKAPLSLWERMAMAGRAGRPRAGGPGFGRAMFVAASLFEAESLWERYVAPEAARPGEETGFSGPAPGAEAGALLALAATAGRCGRADLRGFFARWFPGSGERRHGGSPAADRALEVCLRKELMVPAPPAGQPGGLESSSDPVFSLTSAGRVAASRGITPDTVSALSGWLRERSGEPWCDMEALAALFLTEDGERARVPAGRAGSDWSELAERLRGMSEGMTADDRGPLADLITRCREQELRAARAGRAAEAAALWVSGRGLPEIEGITGLTAGTVLELRDTAAWLSDAAASLAERCVLRKDSGNSCGVWNGASGWACRRSWMRWRPHWRRRGSGRIGRCCWRFGSGRPGGIRGNSWPGPRRKG